MDKFLFFEEKNLFSFETLYFRYIKKTEVDQKYISIFLNKDL